VFWLKDYAFLLKSYMEAHVVMLMYGGDMFRVAHYAMHQIFTMDMELNLCNGYMVEFNG
jgi:hypothetical protein